MNDLLRELAPIPEEAWKEIDREAKRVLALHLAARKVVDFSGPLGWNVSSVSLGRTEALSEAPSERVQARLRKAQALVELRATFSMPRSEIEAIARGAKDADLEPIAAAAKAAAHAEDRAVFHGYAAAGIGGIAELAGHAPLQISDRYEEYPKAVAEAVSRLRTAGVDGPYALVLGPRCYKGLTTTVEGGYPVLQLVQRIVEGPLVWGPAINGAVLLSTRGGDFELSVGRDFSVGYLEHDAREVRLHVEESFTFRVLTPEAAVPLSYAR